MAKNAPIAIVKCLECNAETVLRRNVNMRFYTFCRGGHEHKYSPDIVTANKVPGYVRMYEETPKLPPVENPMKLPENEVYKDVPVQKERSGTTFLL